MLDLVIDIGKTRSKLVVLDGAGVVVESRTRDSLSVNAGDYLALDTAGLQIWLCDAISSLGMLRPKLSRAIVSTHGAAVAAVDALGLVLPVPDYEFAEFDERPLDWPEQIGSFNETASPDLPLGLNLATQLDWLERHRRSDMARASHLLPYAQYWAWWLSGVVSSEVSALGCHTHLWNPREGAWSALAQRRGWSEQFAPLRTAWDTLGPLRPELAQQLGVPYSLQVHVGVHDSNACLARYLKQYPRMTLISTGTWVVVMAPGAGNMALDERRDMLCNVSVSGEAVATGRFMGGRDVQAICQGAPPELASDAVLQSLVLRGIMALPGFALQGGPFRSRAGHVVDAAGATLQLEHLNAAERATLAALYSAQVTAWIIEAMAAGGPFVLDGPFASNAVYASTLAQLLADKNSTATLLVNTDSLDGTVRGGQALLHWREPHSIDSILRPIEPSATQGLSAIHARWLSALV